MSIKKTEQEGPAELTEEAADKVQGGGELDIVFSDILISSVKDDRPKGSTEQGYVASRDADEILR